MIRRKRQIRGTSWLSLATLLTLSATNGAEQSSNELHREGEIAIELFGLIAEQSGCPMYAVAWLDRVTQQIQTRCAVTIEQSKRIAASRDSMTRFLVDIEAAKSDFKNKFSLAGMRRSTALLTHLLTKNLTQRRSKKASGPLLLYFKTDDHKRSAPIAETAIPHQGHPEQFILFKDN